MPSKDGAHIYDHENDEQNMWMIESRAPVLKDNYSSRRRDDARLSFDSIVQSDQILYISPLCAPRALPGPQIRPQRFPLRTHGVWAGCYHMVRVIGMARTAVTGMRLCGAMLWPAPSAAGSGSGPLVVGILGRMLGSDSRRALTIVPMLPHKNAFVQVGPDGELLAVDDSFVACAREVRISYALFCATFDRPW
jgi:hypothetical protein